MTPEVTGSWPVLPIMKIAIVGHEGGKFTLDTRLRAEAIIQEIICNAAGIELGEAYQPKAKNVTVVSGHCHLGGIDIWAENIGMFLGTGLEIYPPAKLEWSGGYRERNIQIAKNCDVIHNIVVAEYPPDYKGMRFEYCYHCRKRVESVTGWHGQGPHIKSGGCWTAWLAHEKFGKPAYWHII